MCYLYTKGAVLSAILLEGLFNLLTKC